MKKIRFFIYFSFLILTLIISFILYFTNFMDYKGVICSICFLLLGFIPSFIIEIINKKRIDNLKLLSFLTNYYEIQINQCIENIEALNRAHRVGLRIDEKIDKYKFAFFLDDSTKKNLCKVIKIKKIQKEMKNWEKDYNKFIVFSKNIYIKLKPNPFEIKQYDIKMSMFKE